jgi:ketosteroid isomerase-like protein
MSPGAIDRWIAEYFRCWREKDVEAVVRLFTPDAVYRSSPFRDPHVGREAIRTYWTRATSSQTGFQVKVGEPIREGRRASVEWWATWTEDGDPVTLPGTLVLRFSADGRCEELREYWHVENHAQDPPENWGR